jgi:SOS-response transcriptional repressor LexA
MNETKATGELRDLVLRERLAIGYSARALAEKVGVSHSYISQIERGIIRRPSLLVLKRLAEALPGASYSRLLAAAGYLAPEGFVNEDEDGCRDRQRTIAEKLWEVAGELTRKSDGAAGTEYRSVQLYSSVPASFGVSTAEPAPQEERERVMIHESRLRGDLDAYALRVHGDSMSGAGILEGDIVIVSPRSQWRSGDVCVVRLNGGEHSIKRLVMQGELVILQPCNSRYEPMAVPPERQGELYVCGKVIHCERSFA